MKTKSLFTLGFIILHSAFCLSARAQGSSLNSFTYQGRLNDTNGPASGLYDFSFALFPASTGGSQVGTTITRGFVPVTNGLFTVPLEFLDANSFSGADRWLEIAVHPSGVGTNITLSPRQQITAAPYAIRALSAGSANTATSVAVGGVNNLALASDAVDGAKILNDTITGADLNASLLNNTFWNLGGNAGTIPGPQFIGTTDNQPLEIKVNSLRALRIEDNGDSTFDSDTMPDGAPNLIGGAPHNFVAAGAVGATIAGGGAMSFFGIAYTNSVLSDFGVIGGGNGNSIAANSRSATISGGFVNDIEANAPYASIAGGNWNKIGTNSDHGAVGGGNGNHIAANSQYATIAGGIANRIGTNAGSSTIGGGQENRIAANSYHATIAGGTANSIGFNSDRNTIGGGYRNNISSNSFEATITGGYGNNIGTNSYYSTIGGGFENNLADNSIYATIPGGRENAATSYAFAAGRQAKAIHRGAFVWADSTLADFASTADNQFAIRASGGVLLSGSTPNLAFGTTTRQMLNLYGVEYGIGVQDFTVYQRTAAGVGNGFAWFRGGNHTNAQNNPGPGGTVLMLLGATGLTVNGTFVSASDRNVKQDFAAVNSRAVLEKVAQLPIQTWAYKNDPHTKHLGPMAQDFYAAFNVGPDDKHITTVDESGVALAAIQGLNQKLDETRAENAELKARLERLESLLNQNARSKD